METLLACFKQGKEQCLVELLLLLRTGPMAEELRLTYDRFKTVYTKYVDHGAQSVDLLNLWNSQSKEGRGHSVALILAKNLQKRRQGLELTAAQLLALVLMLPVLLFRRSNLGDRGSIIFNSISSSVRLLPFHAI